MLTRQIVSEDFLLSTFHKFRRTTHVHVHASFTKPLLFGPHGFIFTTTSTATSLVGSLEAQRQMARCSQSWTGPCTITLSATSIPMALRSSSPARHSKLASAIQRSYDAIALPAPSIDAPGAPRSPAPESTHPLAEQPSFWPGLDAWRSSGVRRDWQWGELGSPVTPSRVGSAQPPHSTFSAATVGSKIPSAGEEQRTMDDGAGNGSASDSTGGNSGVQEAQRASQHLGSFTTTTATAAASATTTGAGATAINTVTNSAAAAEVEEAVAGEGSKSSVAAASAEPSLHQSLQPGSFSNSQSYSYSCLAEWGRRVLETACPRMKIALTHAAFEACMAGEGGERETRAEERLQGGSGLRGEGDGGVFGGREDASGVGDGERGRQHHRACEQLARDDQCMEGDASASRAGKKKMMAIGMAAAPDQPARPDKPPLVPPRKVPKPGSPGTLPLNAHMLHMLAHVEMNAVDLAWDTLVRFSPLAQEHRREEDGEESKHCREEEEVRRGENCSDPSSSAQSSSSLSSLHLPRQFFLDFLRVADDESRHLGWCLQRLNELGCDYGDMPAHNLLWKDCQKSASSLEDRMAIIPMVQEARGLDAGPRLVQRLIGHGDVRSAGIVQRIAEEEEAHVAVGVVWFHWACRETGMNPYGTFRGIIRDLCADGVKGPFNHEARQRVGLPQHWYTFPKEVVDKKDASDLSTIDGMKLKHAVHERLALFVASEERS